jgi:phenylpropionate dioxygenase-like ring-hydroxylating dioxygenase large terminal subunit
VTLLGRDLVLWKDGNEKRWRCFIDSCPHRLAPLSEGRIEPRTGHLQCAYHGWEFDQDGTCTKIPQVGARAWLGETACTRRPPLISLHAQLDPDGPETARQSRRACATALPAQTAQGMVWVWADGSQEGLEASKHVKPNVMDDVDERSMSYLVVSRDMPVGGSR